MNSNKKYVTEVLVGAFMILGFFCFLIVATRFDTQTVIFAPKGYTLSAKFDSISGLKEGSLIEIAGVKVGRVSKISLENYRAKVEMLIDEGIKIDDEAIASIRTKGIIGEKYIKITEGTSEEYLNSGDMIDDTEPVVDIEELIGKFINK
jgi:phospholipid/cholesterol/gamma-HCH transport system substrate-binding protein